MYVPEAYTITVHGKNPYAIHYLRFHNYIAPQNSLTASYQVMTAPSIKPNPISMQHGVHLVNEPKTLLLCVPQQSQTSTSDIAFVHSVIKLHVLYRLLC